MGEDIAMTDEEMNMWQHIDELSDKLEAVEAKLKDMNNAWLVFMDMQAKILEQRNERS